jgi:hypothetical protein
MMGWTILAAALASLCTFASPGSAATISYAEAARALVAACGADVNAHCKGVKPGADRIQRCLLENRDEVSIQCIQTYETVFASLVARAAAQAAVPKVCASDVKHLCSNFRAGGGHILGCLTRKDNVRKVHKKCNEAITEAGWR